MWKYLGPLAENSKHILTISDRKNYLDWTSDNRYPVLPMVFKFGEIFLKKLYTARNMCVYIVNAVIRPEGYCVTCADCCAAPYVHHVYKNFTSYS